MPWTQQLSNPNWSGNALNLLNKTEVFGELLLKRIPSHAEMILRIHYEGVRLIGALCWAQTLLRFRELHLQEVIKKGRATQKSSSLETTGIESRKSKMWVKDHLFLH